MVQLAIQGALVVWALRRPSDDDHEPRDDAATVSGRDRT